MKQSKFLYRVLQCLAWFVAVFIFKRKFLRNEIKGKQGPFVIVANHEASLDFVNLIGATSTPLHFVISKSFYDTLPFEGIVSKLGMIPKQQFQTSVRDLHRMKSVIENGGVLVIYPAGLMCEDGLSTPIPVATYEFLKWLKTDVYVAKTSGTYFSMPKWSKGMRRGRTYLDVYKMFSKEQLANTTVETVKEKTDEALNFDAYYDQEKMLIRYRRNADLTGLENVLYMCPECKTEFSVRIRKKRSIYCEVCGFAETSDEYAFLHRIGKGGQEFRYVSEWSKLILDTMRDKMRGGDTEPLATHAKITMIDPEKRKFGEAGDAEVTLYSDRFTLKGTLKGEAVNMDISTATFASLPFKPGKYFEIQHGDDIYRCYPDNGQIVMKYINMVKIYYEINTERVEREKRERREKNGTEHATQADKNQQSAT